MLMNLQCFNIIFCEGCKREVLWKFIFKLQVLIIVIEDCCKLVLVVIYGVCVGGVVDIIVVCDMCYCSCDVYFVIKEIDLGLVVDIGILQCLFKIVLVGIVVELVYIGCWMEGVEVGMIGFCNIVYEDWEQLYVGVQVLVKIIVLKLLLCICGIKEILFYM